jgi:hypothetical protein
MKGFLYSADQNFYIDGLKLSGVSSMNGSYSIEYENHLFAGYVGSPDLSQNAPASARFSFQRTMLSSDKPITDLIGDVGFNGGIEYNGKKLSFESGYLNSYSVNFSVDSIPDTSIDLSIYGEMGPNVTIEKTKPSQSEFFIPSSSGISLNCDGREENRVTSFSFSISPQRKPFYKIGSIYPCEVAYLTPIQSTFTVELDVDSYETINTYDYIRTGIHFKDIEISLKDKCDDTKTITYKFKKSHLISENFSSDSENNTKVSLEYISNSHAPPEIIYT